MDTAKLKAHVLRLPENLLLASEKALDDTFRWIIVEDMSAHELIIKFGNSKTETCCDVAGTHPVWSAVWKTLNLRDICRFPVAAFTNWMLFRSCQRMPISESS